MVGSAITHHDYETRPVSTTSRPPKFRFPLTPQNITIFGWYTTFYYELRLVVRVRYSVGLGVHQPQGRRMKSGRSRASETERTKDEILKVSTVNHNPELPTLIIVNRCSRLQQHTALYPTGTILIVMMTRSKPVVT